MKTILILFLFFYSNLSKIYTTRFFPGFNAGCEDLQEQEKDRCVPIKDKSTSKISIKEQGIKGCEFLQNELKKKNIDRYIFVGFSQGGLVARFILSYCKDVAEKVARVINLGTPNLGINLIPLFFQGQAEMRNQEFSNSQKIVESPNIFQKGFANFITFGAKTFYSDDQCPNVYINDINQPSKFIQNLNLLEDLLEKNSDWYKRIEMVKKRYLNLEFMLNLEFAQDTMISIIESSLFGMEVKMVKKATEEDRQIQIQRLKQIHKNIYDKLEKQSEKYFNPIYYTQEESAQMQEKLDNLKKQIEDNERIVDVMDKMRVEPFNALGMKRKFVGMYNPFPQKTAEVNEKEWKQQEIQYYEKKVVPLANVLEEMYQNRKLIQCVINGKHLQFPSIFIENEKNNYEWLTVKFFEDIEKENVKFEDKIFQLMNCSYKNENEII